MTSAAAPHFTKFGRYDIVRKLGRSVSDVYLAHDSAIGRQVVLKIVEQCGDSWTQAIAEAERRGAAIQQQLHAIDPRVLEIYDVGLQNGSFYVAMQYAEGRSVAELLEEKGRLAPAEAAAIASEICSQLVSLHSFEAEIDGKKRAVVHGDIKPSNIQIGPEGEVRLLDFGIAKAISATRKLTHHDLGSPAYCSPERLNSSFVDPHADLWAVGVSLYEMVAGLPPYQAQTTRKLESVIQSRRPPRALPSDCPATLRVIIEKALAADSASRYGSAREFETDLRGFLSRRPTEAHTERWWQANATVEKPRQAQPVRLRAPRVEWRSLIVSLRSARASLLAGILCGLFVFVPAAQFYRFRTDSTPLRDGRDYAVASDAVLDQDMQLLARFERDYEWLRGFSPVPSMRRKLGTRLVAAADNLFAAYRTNAGATLEAFDWSRARACLQRALLLNPSESAIRGKLALAEGYEALRTGSGAADEVLGHLTTAATLLPAWPDPRLALARFFIYRQKNLGRAVAEWHTAERLGFMTGPREWEQEGDGYLERVETTFSDLRGAAAREDQRRLYSLLQRDAIRARQRYEPITGFGRVTASLSRLEQFERSATALESTRTQAQRKRSRRDNRTRSWR
jgi:tRNA A-37 threonylcarbamoyl transferase component Bud32